MPGFADLEKRYRALAEKPSKIAEAARDDIETLVRQEFSLGNDPYGRPWANRKDGSRSTLFSSGALQSSLSVKVQDTTIEISISDYKFAFHQRTRPILSIGVMPPSWASAIENAFNSIISQK